MVAGLLIWAVTATFLLFRRQYSNVYVSTIEKTEIESKDSDHKSVSNGEGGTMKLSSDNQDRLSLAQQLSSDRSGKPHLARYASKIFHQDSEYEREGFTMIMLTYKRVKVLPKLLLHYCKAKRLHKILVIWNDVGSQIPQEILDLANKCEVTLQFIHEKENKLTNRFKPRPEIETECKWNDMNGPSNCHTKGVVRFVNNQGNIYHGDLNQKPIPKSWIQCYSQKKIPGSYM